MTTSALPDVLARIVARRRQRYGLSTGRLEAPALAAATRSGGASVLAPSENAFCAALTRRRGRAVIAEVKMGSPKLGSLAGSLDPEKQARIYAESGAAALSVVVEPDFFHGSYDLLAACRKASGLPTIAKDFVVSERQLEEAGRAGASAVLLIAALYDARSLVAWARAARSLGLAPLVETHDESDLEKVAGHDWEVVGINNRDLRTFGVDLQRSMRLVARLPRKPLKVAESGIRAGSEVEALRGAGFDAFLVGESLLLAEDPAAKLRELGGIAS